MKKTIHFRKCWTYIIILASLFLFALAFGIGSDYVLKHAEEFDFLSKVIYRNGDLIFTKWHLLICMKVCFCTCGFVLVLWFLVKWCTDNITKAIY